MMEASFNIFGSQENGRQFVDDIFKGMFLREKYDIWLKFHPSLLRDAVQSKSAFFQGMGQW